METTVLTAVVGVANQVHHMSVVLHWAWLRAQKRDSQPSALEWITFREVVGDESIECLLRARFVVLVNAVLGGLCVRARTKPTADPRQSLAHSNATRGSTRLCAI